MAMLAHTFPNLDWLKKQANSGFADRKRMDGHPLEQAGWPNVILNVKTAVPVFRDNIKGPVSLFSNVSGHSTVTVDDRRYTIPPGVFFVLNAGQHYTLETGSTPTETLNIHFGDHFSREALKALDLTAAEYLEGKDQLQEPTFHNRIAPVQGRLKTLLLHLHSKRAEMSEEEILFEILTVIVGDEAGLRSRKNQITALKASTRDELMKRMLLAADYLHAAPETQPSLDDLARISCLSKFHFLRLFKVVFRQTPHQYLNEVRVEKAKELLAHSDCTIQSIADTLGFQTAASFSRTFHRHTGVYPSPFRLASIR